MSITDQLEEERRIINAATAGPWREDEHDTSALASIVSTAIDRPWGWVEVARSIGADAAFIAHARTALPLRNAQVEAVLELCDPNFNLSIPDDIKRRFRRAIEEAGA